MDEFWDSQDIFELRDGAYLWSGSYPAAVYEPRLPPKVKTALDFLEFEIKAGRLEVLHWKYPGARRVRRQDLQRLAEQRDYHPSTLFPNQQPAPAPAGPDNTPLSATERGNLQKQIAALALRLANSNPPKFKNKKGDRVMYSRVSLATQVLLDSIENALSEELTVDLNRAGVSDRELRENISIGLKLLLGRKN